ncbi:MAG: hypothetical protein K0B02_02665 [DPANN group archaeon]|nr:hypothetical protein [DPANN group archaeon]
MTKNTKYKMSVLLIGALVLFSIVGMVSAYKGNATPVGPNYNEDIHEAMKQAIENGDYDAWIQIREDNNMPMHCRMFSIINEENFHLFAEMHEANENGDLDRAAEIKAELGLGQGNGNCGMGTHMGNKGNAQGTQSNFGNCQYH